MELTLVSVIGNTCVNASSSFLIRTVAVHGKLYQLYFFILMHCIMSMQPFQSNTEEDSQYNE